MEGSRNQDADSGRQLACVRCSKVAKLQCPKCLELKLPRSNASFCSQECFKESWIMHKPLHSQLELQNNASGNGVHDQYLQGWMYCLRKGQARSTQLPYFAWTGPLRPYPISPRRLVPENIQRPEWASSGRPQQEMVSEWQTSVEIKSAEQIARLRHACKVARDVLDAAARAIKPGVTADKIDEIVHDATISAGAYPSPLNYHFFPKSCCTSVNEVVCHGIPDSRQLEEGDIVNVDVTIYLNGCHADLNETYFVGKVDQASETLVRTTYECLEKAIAIVKPGVRYREVGEVISRHASLAGLSVVKSYCGHGIGELFHCAPNIPHYSHNKAVGMMKAGQTFTIEPMINSGVWRDRMWPDGWTSVTADGKRSAQFEHTLLVTETGVEVLTARVPSSPNVFPWLNNSL